jgi:hypothetical protein
MDSLCLLYSLARNLGVALEMTACKILVIDDLESAFPTEESYLSLKQVIALGTYHEAQQLGHYMNHRFGQALKTIIEKYGVRTILEEWWPSPQPSFASTLATPAFEWVNIGTPEEPQSETTIECLNCHPPSDPTKPILREYGPLAAQELREDHMVQKIRSAMQPFEAGLLIIGLAQLHSMLIRLSRAGFAVRGYSWMEER